MSYENFFSFIKGEANKIARFINKSEKIRIISHLDADGLCSAAMIVKLLLKFNKKFHLTIVKQLESETIDGLAKGKYDLYIFTDIGSGKVDEMEKLMDKKVVIIDHHPPKKEIKNENLVHINPHLFNIDGGQEISASTLNYLVVENFGIKDIGHLAIVGSLGDNQEVNGELIGINKIVLEKIENVEIKKGLRIFGRISKPIYKALAQSTDPYIPGVSGDEGLAIQFLSEIGINPKNGEEWRKLDDLSEEEEKTLASGIIIRRMNNSEKNPTNIFGTIYKLKNVHNMLADAKEFATILNSCGRQGMQSVGIMLALGEKKDAIKAMESIMNNYRQKIVKALRWVEENNEEGRIIKTENSKYIIAKDEIEDTIIGTICSMLAANKNTKEKFIVGFANSTNGVKVSVRLNSFKGMNVDVGELLKRVAEKMELSEFGGHAKAGGAKIPMGKEKEFIEFFEESVKNING